MSAAHESLFALCCCEYPENLLDKQMARAGRAALLKRVQDTLIGKQVVAVGDMVYVDATANLADAGTLDERFATAYRDVRMDWSKMEVIAMLDDHELEDNLEPYRPDTLPTDVLRPALKRFVQWRVKGEAKNYSTRRLETLQLWWDGDVLTPRGFPLFLANTRTERNHRDAASIHSARIMSPGQFDALKRWMLDKRDTKGPKFIACPAMLIPRSLAVATASSDAAALRSDAWDGFPSQFRELLAFIIDNEIHDLIFVSGDEHLAIYAKGTLESADGRKRVTIQSVHAPALYAPFPFANGYPALYSEAETFRWPLDCGYDKWKYSCTVSAEFPPIGDGFVHFIAKACSDSSGGTNLVAVFVDAVSDASQSFMLCPL